MPRRKKKKRLPKKGELHRYAPGGHAGTGKPFVALCVVADGIHDGEADKLRCALLRCLLSEDQLALPEGVRVHLLTPHEARTAGVRVPNYYATKKRVNREARKAWGNDDDVSVRGPDGAESVVEPAAFVEVPEVRAGDGDSDFVATTPDENEVTEGD